MTAIITGFEYISMDEVNGQARARGAEDGKAAGSWVFDGNTDEVAYRNAMVWNDEGDPLFEEYFGAPNPLSGEHADGLTVSQLIDELGYTELTPEEVDEVAASYEEAFFDAHREEVLRVALEQSS
jgi:hypothetical protein